MAHRLHLGSGSASSDNKAFREAIAKMRQEVLESQAETQRVRDQLNCLVMLVKRAWIGDQAAAKHVAKIVGSAPPTFSKDDETDKVDAVSKTRSLHHWAMLSIGLMNRHLRQLESQALSRARNRLQRRQDYLDQQLAKHRQLLKQASGRGLASTKKATNPYLEQQTRKPQQAWNTRPKSSKPGPLAQPEFDYPAREFRPTKPDPALPTSMVEHLAREALAEREFASASRDKYSQPALFSASYVVPDRSKSKHPNSGNQTTKDSQRARPKSAVITTTKGERPLKYETTRPVLGKPLNSTRPRPKSAKAPSRNRIFEMTEGEPSNLKQGKYAALNLQDLSLLDEKRERNGDDDRRIRDGVRGHTHYEDTVTEGLRQIETMEEDFKRTTKMLQEKLGIRGNGAI